MNLSEKIGIIRKARKFTQEELGDKIGVSRQTVSSWEKGEFEPTLDSIRAIAQVLDVSFDTLLDDEIDLKDKQVLNRALKHLGEETKEKVNNSFRYRIRQYSIKNKDYATIVVYFTILGLLIIGAIVNAFFIKGMDTSAFIEYIIGLALIFMLGIISIPIRKIKLIAAGGPNYSFGTLSQTHLVIIGWSDSKFDRTVYIPVSEIESMELGKGATRRHGTVVVKIKERSKPLVTNDIVEPQKLIDIFNNLETFIESPYGK